MPKPKIQNPFAQSVLDPPVDAAANAVSAYDSMGTSNSAWGTSGASAWGAGAKPAAADERIKAGAALGGDNLVPVDLGSSLASKDLNAREAALDKREAALKAREAQLQQMEKDIRRQAGVKKNWPICAPVVHHDIAEDVPSHMRGVVRQNYMAYLGLCACLMYNFFGACVMLGLNAPDRMSSFFLAIIYTISGVPLAFIFWYLKLYHAAASNGSLTYLGYFIGMVIHVAFCIWAAIAPPIAGGRWSFTGFVSAMRAFDVGKFGGIVFLIGAALWTVEGVWSLWCLQAVYRNFRRSGHQEKAQAELQSMALNQAIKAKFGDGNRA